ncbi:hypothetical protein [Acidianus bottle-shaped virus 3 strain ABV3]|uniref:Uncharacterized protein n=1 Tax=Acidianus bottle-shaped virus 3 strain ABV3 TaxID=1732174 RepID=A0A0N9PCP4_9VIRU|nr:hypothetical protein AVU00_gp13 [Acidianus bottle-shaped virus 3 strain ABV3]ALG96815.1 hypothetical protein [Acidianus bottle-shaped virus 3 strain ABV3]
MLADADIIINLFFLFQKKVSIKDALILTTITLVIMYTYIIMKEKQLTSS